MNLFGYTGVGTLALSAAGAQMVHVDASKKSVAQARENAALSGMADAPIRWIVDDAAKFVAREVRRERRYDGILLDPPKYGRGPDGEVWRLEEDLPELIANCRQLLDAKSRFLFLTVYAVRMSAMALGNLLRAHFADLPGNIEFGELAVREQARGLFATDCDICALVEIRIDMKDLLTLEVHDLHVNVLTGIYSQETHLPQPLHISVKCRSGNRAALCARYAAVGIKKLYGRSKNAATEFPEGVHFTLIEAVADHIIDRLFAIGHAVSRR